MIVISSREFRQNQKKYFERVDKGEHIIVQRGRDKAYTLTPVSEDDMYFTAENMEKIKQSILEIEQGDTHRISTSKAINDLLGL
jgi:PHD/YefM family antitoxin component YafN of YafNO toxin-antitoxin module